jgi:hypothetical protein
VIDLLRRNHSFAEAPVNYKFSHNDFLNAKSFVKLSRWREGALACDAPRGAAAGR